MSVRAGEPVTVVIASAGRRLYLIDWFREAFASLGVNGQVLVTENDRTSSAFSAGDVSWHMPAYADPAYADSLRDLVRVHRPVLFVSVNDYELLHLHGDSGLGAELAARGVHVTGVDPAWQAACGDKLAMTTMLRASGVAAPRTVLASDGGGLDALRGLADEFVVKHRFGSGSSGLGLVRRDGIPGAVAEAMRTAPPVPRFADPHDAVVVQPRLPGQEYGVDIIGSLTAPGELRGVLARRKLRMRAGETDKAVTVDPAPFRDLAARIATSSGLTGLIDVDVFLAEGCPPTVIDINPRFGGGYPFVHLAGADAPGFHLAEVLGAEPPAGWNDYEYGVTSAKFESARVTGRSGGDPGRIGQRRETATSGSVASS